MTQSIREQIKCRKDSEPEDSRVAGFILPIQKQVSFISLVHYLFFDSSDFYYLCPLFCTSLHFIFFRRPILWLPQHSQAVLPRPPPHFLSPPWTSRTPASPALPLPQAALTPSSICSTDSWFPRGLRGDRDHRALWNLYAQISSWIRRRRRSAVALQGRRDEQGVEKIRK